MDTDQNSQHQHAQWLASLATEHFVQQALNAAAKNDTNQTGKTEDGEEEDSNIVDMSRHAVVKLATDAMDEGTPPHEEEGEVEAPGTPFNLRRNLKKRKHESDEEEHEFKLIRSKDRGCAKGIDMRRPVRPIDRQKMRPWLKHLLDTGAVFGLNWLQRDEGVFQISWRHASRLGWNLETDGDVFERWARHTGIFKDGDEPEPKRWKANFRCALHSLPDVKELTSPTDRKGRNASRTYRFLRPNEVQPPVKRKQRYNVQLPFALLESQANEDNSSHQADSDERNSEEEASVPVKIQAFPLCDHDYAIPFNSDKKPGGELASPEALPRQTSGYVLIKSKDAHEIEFRLTPPQSAHQSPTKRSPSSSSSKPSPQKKIRATKKKQPGSTPVRRGKNKPNVSPKPALKKDGRPPKKAKKAIDSSSGEPSPATKVSLKELLSGRKNASSGGKKGKSAQMGTLASKKVKRLKKPASPRAKRNSRPLGMNCSVPSCVQAQGLDALLEAANQIEGLSKAQEAAQHVLPTVVSSSTVAGTDTGTSQTQPIQVVSQSAPKVSLPPPQSLAAGMPSKTLPPHTKSAPASQFMMSGVSGSPIILTAHPVVGAKPTPAITSIPMLASLAGAGNTANTGPTPVSLGVLQKLLGLQNVQTIPASCAPVSLVPGQVLPRSDITTTKAEVKKFSLKPIAQKPAKTIYVNTKPASLKPSEQKFVDQNLASRNKSKEKVGGKTSLLGMPKLVTQPEGTSMLKHLLRLTGPTMNMSSTPITTTTFAATTVPSPPPPLPQVTTSSLKVRAACSGASLTMPSQSTPSLSQLFTAAGLTMKETNAAAALSAVKVSTCPVTGTNQNNVDSVAKSGQQQVAGFPLGALQTAPGHNGSVVVQEPLAQYINIPAPMETEEEPMGQPAASRVYPTGTQQTCEVVGLPSSGVVQVCTSSPLVSPAPVDLTQTAAAPVYTTSCPQVTICLPAAAAQAPLTQQVATAKPQTMTVAVPQGLVTTLPAQSQANPVNTFTHSLDLLQFLNMCAANSGNGQFLIRTEPTPPTNMSSASSSSVVPEQVAGSRGVGGETVMSTYSMVEPCEKVNNSVNVVSDVTGGQGLGTPRASECGPALAVAAESPALLPTFDTTATMDTSALSAAVQSLNTINSSSLSSTILDPLAAAMQSSAISTSADCVSGLSSASGLSAADLATALTEVPGVDVPTAHQMTEAGMALPGAHDTMTQQFVDEANLVIALSADQQGADSFIVEEMLL